MAIVDINGDYIKQNKYNEYDKVVNIEFGSGKNYFGKCEYPECYLTDKNIPQTPHFIECLPDYHEADCHYIDFACDFYHHNFNGRLFKKIVLCNPYEFGYKGLLEAKIFFNRAGDLLENSGRIIIICSRTNPYVKKAKLDEYLTCSSPLVKSNYQFVLEEFEEMDAMHRIRKEYKFKQSCLKSDATPHQKITIKKISTQ
jgi:hypothetical protein